jgi:hypothetical protein
MYMNGYESWADTISPQNHSRLSVQSLDIQRPLRAQIPPKFVGGLMNLLNGVLSQWALLKQAPLR